MSDKPSVSISTLIRRRAMRLRDLEDAAPVEFAKWRAVEVEIERLTEGESKRFAKFRRPNHAIIECLRQKGDWMQKPAIVEELILGGMPQMEGEKAAFLMVKLISKMRERKQLLSRPHPSGKAKDEYVGLPEWKDKPFNPKPVKERPDEDE